MTGLPALPLSETAPPGTVVRDTHGWVWLCDAPRGHQRRWIACGVQAPHDLPTDRDYHILHDPRKTP